MADSFWDDFSNNLATDLAPFIALLGESPTKQYLSECLTIEDIIIFTLAPIGVITAVVSAIRVCGTPSMRAFVGKAQEGAGVAEAELCSSTSRDVCELHTNGGVARVFGRPKLLEIVHDPDASIHEFYPSDRREATAGIYSFSEYIETNKGREEWKLQQKFSGRRKNHSGSIEKGTKDEPGQFAPNPNLSLNIGIKPLPRPWFVAAIAAGVTMQGFVLVWAVLTRYHYQWIRGNTQDEYAIPVVILGTCLLSLGMGLCAWLIESKTEERIYYRTTSKDTSTTMHWVQPGNQIVGDQVFDSFAYDDTRSRLQKYITSWKSSSNRPFTFWWIWIAVLTTVIGFILQFLGLRACHSSVAVVQLAVTICMSLIRAGLRTQRLKREDNFMTADPDFFQGHELDFLTMRMSQCKQPSMNSSTTGLEGQSAWKIFCPFQVSDEGSIRTLDSSIQSSPSLNVTEVLTATKLFQMSSKGRSVLFGFRILPNYPAPNSAKELMDLAEKDISHWVLKKYCPQCEDNCVCRTADSEKNPNTAIKSVFLRSRLAQMTGLQKPESEHSSYWGEKFVSVRNTALRLTSAIEKTMDILFNVRRLRFISSRSVLLLEDWTQVFAIFWTIRCSWLGISTDRVESNVPLSLRRRIDLSGVPEGEWKAESSEIEAVLSLWVWSLQEPYRVQDGERANERRNGQRIVRILRGGQNPIDMDSGLLDYEVWREPGGVGVERYLLEECDSTFGSSKTQNAIWCKDGAKLVANKGTSSHLPEHQRCFGWYNIQKIARGDLNVLAVPSKNTLLLNCAQDIFCIFLTAIVQSVEILGNTTIDKEGGNDMKAENDTLRDIQRVLINEDLCDVDDAFACTVPILVHQNKLKPLRKNLFAAFRLAEKYRQNKKLKDCKALLSWCLRISGHGELEEWSDEDSPYTSRSFRTRGLQQYTPAEDKNRLRCSIIEVCELYRRSLIENDVDQKTFGCDGILELLRMCSRDNEIKDMELVWVDCATGPGTLSDGGPTYDLTDTVKCYGQTALWSMKGSTLNEGQRKLQAELQEYQIKAEDIPEGNLRKAICDSNLSHTLYLLQRHRITEPEKSESLIWASRKGWFMVVESLAKLGAKIDKTDEQNRTALSYALEFGDVNTVMTLVKNGAPLRENPRSGIEFHRVFLWAARQGHATIAKYIMAEDDTARYHLPEALRLAIISGNIDTVQVLLSTGNIRVEESNGEPPLHLAVEQRKGKIVDLLLKNDKINPNRSEGRLVDSPPLTWAVRLKNKDIFIQILDEARVDADVADKNGRTALWWASALGLDCYIQLLRCSGKVHEPNKEDCHGDSPLSIAVKAGHVNAVHRLWEWNMLKQSTVLDLKTILIAAKNGKADIVGELLPYILKDKNCAEQMLEKMDLKTVWDKIKNSDNWRKPIDESWVFDTDISITTPVILPQDLKYGSTVVEETLDLFGDNPTLELERYDRPWGVSSNESIHPISNTSQTGGSDQTRDIEIREESYTDRYTVDENGQTVEFGETNEPLQAWGRSRTMESMDMLETESTDDNSVGITMIGDVEEAD